MTTLQTIRRIFKEFMMDPRRVFNTFEFIEVLDNIEYTLTDVENFCRSLKEIEEIEHRNFSFCGGILLSRLYQKIIKENDVVTLNLENIKPLDYVSSFHQRGKLVINGNVGRYLGLYMNTGEIVLNGNADGEVGRNMAGGVITVNGNVEGSIGDWMTDGEIHLEGNYTSTYCGHNLIGGGIYHKGVLIKSRKIILADAAKLSMERYGPCGC